MQGGCGDLRNVCWKWVGNVSKKEPAAPLARFIIYSFCIYCFTHMLLSEMTHFSATIYTFLSTFYYPIKLNAINFL